MIRWLIELVRAVGLVVVIALLTVLVQRAIQIADASLSPHSVPASADEAF